MNKKFDYNLLKNKVNRVEKPITNELRIKLYRIMNGKV
jgi:hypothetical protein